MSFAERTKHRLKSLLRPSGDAPPGQQLAQARKQLERQREKTKELRRKLRATSGRLKHQNELLEHERKQTKHLKRLDVSSAFHVAYYELGAAEGGTWMDTYWLGTPAQKLPLDLWVYQEIFHERRPDLIIETGTQDGGSALYMASLCDLLGAGKILTIDITERGRSGAPRPEHPRIRYLLGSSTDPATVDEVRREVGEARAERVMVVLDSDHSREHVLAEMRAYAPLVTAGDYLVVEDTNLSGHPIGHPDAPGPMEAVEEFLAGSAGDNFVPDRAREKFLVTFNPKGYLRRLR